MGSDLGDNGFLAWFLGPKAENAQFLEDNILLALRDYVHWRRNYYPGDRLLVSQTLRKELEAEHDSLSQNILEMMAELRRNFPFYSPRYIAHQLSDTSLPAIIGYIAGLLYNPNNITPEAAPVTVEWEIEACNQILAMLGYTAPPSPPTSKTQRDDYMKRIEAGFGWAHITHGGTTATIEALWFARTIRYAPLAIRCLAEKYHLPLYLPRAILKHGRSIPSPKVKTTAGTPQPTKYQTDIRDLNEEEVFLLAPNEAIFLLATYIKAARVRLDKTDKEAIRLLDESPFSTANGVGTAIAKYPPAIFVSGAKHYSVTKAAQVLGLGRNCIVPVRMDSSFRLDTADLENKIRQSLHAGKVPLAVVAIAGTTEEGAVDPIDQIIDLRDRLEAEGSTSFWLHIDAAWGGFLRCLFRESDALLFKAARAFGIPSIKDLPSLHTELVGKIRQQLENRRQEFTALKADLERRGEELAILARQGRAAEYAQEIQFLASPAWGAILRLRELGNRAASASAQRHAKYDGPWVASHPTLQRLSDRLSVDPGLAGEDWHSRTFQKVLGLLKDRLDVSHLDARLAHLEERLGVCAKAKDQDGYVREFRKFGTTEWAQALPLNSEQFKVSARDRLENVQSFVRGTVDVGYKDFTVQWPFRPEVGNAFVAFPMADSITIDPHKMGYLPYPCGIVAFKNDRVRHFVLEEAPYITSARQMFDAHQPPRHVASDYLVGEDPSGSRTKVFDKPRIEVDAFAPFILEGSRPGAAASALWLSTRTIPLNMQGHGAILRASLLAARELFEWLTRWDRTVAAAGAEAFYDFVPLTEGPPDTNIVTFVVRRHRSRRLRPINNLSSAIYKRFSIQAELGAREYSYSQPFFLSHTTLHEPDYPYETVAALLRRCEVNEPRAEYRKYGITVLRATMMNPYIWPMKVLGVRDLVKEFVEELAEAAEVALATSPTEFQSRYPPT